MTEYQINLNISAESEEQVDMTTDLIASYLNTPLPPDYLGRGLPGVEFEGMTVEVFDNRGEVSEQYTSWTALHKFFVMCKDDFGRYNLVTSRSFETFKQALKYAEGIAPSRKAVVLTAVGGFCDRPDCEPYHNGG